MSKILCVLDGLGLLPKSENNAAALAKMPNFKYLLKNYFWTTLNADGEQVGQENGLVGNSEVGHMNIGGLKLVPQLSYQITKSSSLSYDLDESIAPDQLFDPKKFMEHKWNNITFDEIKKLQDQASVKILEAYNLSVQSGCLNAGETLSTDSHNTTVNYFFEFIETWWTYTDLSYEVIKDMANSSTKEDKIKKVFGLILEAYDLIGAKFSVEALRYFNSLKNTSKVVHLIGLFSTGTIHSDLRHWAGAIEAAGKAGAEKIVMHLISDGRDSDRQSLVATWDFFVKEFEAKIKSFEAKIFLGSVGGRFYSLDRDNNFDRVTRGILPMFNYKTFNKEDVGYFESLKKYAQTKYNVDLNKVLELEKQKFEKDNLDFEPTEENFQKSKNFYVHTEEHFFFLNEDKQEREKLGPLKTDIRWMLEHYSKQWYGKEVYDEFILPCNWYYLPLSAATRPFAGISKDDTVWLLNFRTDRMKQFSKVLTDIDSEFDLNLTIMGMNDYCIDSETYLDEHFNVVRQKSEIGYYPVFKNQPVQGTLAEYISKNGKTQLHIAETEKYNHVTYFMNGGQNKKWEGEDWQVIDSNKVASHAEMPEMKAKEVTDYILESGLGKYDYIIVNYANPDMVGHTGDIKAAIKTMEFLDLQIGRLISACEAGGHQMIFTADHGNIEKVGDYNQNGKSLIDTEHNANFVPLIILSEDLKKGNQIKTDKLLQNVEKLLESKVSNPNLDLIKSTLTEENQVDLDSDSWLMSNQIPTPKLPLWTTGLLLICL